MTTATEWPVYQHDNRRSGRTAQQLDAPALGQAWIWQSTHPPQPAWAGPAKYDAYSNVRPLRSMRNYDPAFHVIAANGCVYFGSSVDDSVRCIDAETGEAKWAFTTDGPVRIAPALANGPSTPSTGSGQAGSGQRKLYFGSDDGHAYCVRADDGALVWKSSPARPGRRVLNNGGLIPLAPCRTGVLVDDGTAYFACGMLPWEDSYLCAVDAETGKPSGPGRYIARFPGVAPERAGDAHREGITMEGALLASADRLFIPQGRVAPRMFNRATGDLIASVQSGGGGCFVLLTDDDQLVHGPGNKTGWMSVSSAATGEAMATFDDGTAAVVADDTIYVLTRTSLSAVARGSGEPVWSVPCDCPYSLVLAGDTLFAGGYDTVAAFDTVDGKRLWAAPVRGKAHGLAVAAGRLLATTDEGAVHCFAPGQDAGATSASTPDTDEIADVAEPTAPRDLALSPYLQFTGDDSAVVRWRTKQPCPTWLGYGLTGPDKIVEDPAPKTEHEVTLTGLRKEAVHTCKIRGAEGDEVVFECDTHFNYNLPAIPDRPYPYPGDRMADAAAAKQILDAAEIDRGICVVLGCGEGRLAYELARRADIRVIGFDTSADNVAAARRALLDAGLYGARVAVHHVDSLGALPCVGAFANLVVSDRARTDEECAGPGAEAFRVLAPNGVALLKGPDGWSEPVGRSPLPGTGVWSHQYGRGDNAACGGETLQGAKGTDALAVQWLGRPGPRYQPDRNGRKPAPLAVNGRLFGQGRRRMVALDAHNGTVLWSLEIPGFARFNMPRDCGNWCADRHHVFAAVKDECWQIDAATGSVAEVFDVLPAGRPGWEWDWGYVGDGGDTVIGSAVKRGSAFVEFTGHPNWYDAKEGEPTFKVCSENLFALHKRTGEVRWSYAGGLIINPTITMSEAHVYFAECRHKDVIASESRRVGMPEMWDEMVLVALDLATGEKLWDVPLTTAPGSVVFYLAHCDGKLILMASDVADGKYHTYCFDAADGSARWDAHFDWMSDNHGGHMSHVAVGAGKVFVRPRVLDLETGRLLGLRMPGGGCGTYALTEHVAVFRSSHVTLWDFDADAATNWHRLRPGCWLSTVPALGMVLSPEAGGGCSCGSWLETSIAFMPTSAT